MTLTTQIGRGQPLFILPGDRFINATKPLAAMAPQRQERK